MSYPFNELKWVTAHTDIPETSEREAIRIARLRANYPELSSWGSFALNEAWGMYSEDCWLVSMQAVDERDPWFLGYLYQVELGHGAGRWNGDTELAREGEMKLRLNLAKT